MKVKRNEAAEVQRRLLLWGCIDVEEIVDWADSEVAKDETPPPQLLELSLMREFHPLDIVGKLRELATDCDSFECLRYALGEVWRRIDAGRDVNLYSLTHVLEWIPDEYDHGMRDDLSILRGIGDYIYLATHGGMTKEEAEQALLEELRAFHVKSVSAGEDGSLE